MSGCREPKHFLDLLKKLQVGRVIKLAQMNIMIVVIGLQGTQRSRSRRLAGWTVIDRASLAAVTHVIAGYVTQIRHVPTITPRYRVTAARHIGDRSMCQHRISVA